MHFTETPLEGLWIVDTRSLTDARGSFARLFAKEAFEAHGLRGDFVHVNASTNASAGTIRGMHFQTGEHAETKLVRCSRGAVFDVAVDVREASPTRHRWFGIELDAEHRRQLYVPEGFAHGFQTLVPDTELIYLMSTVHAPEAAAGLRWNDPAIGIDWPIDDVPVMSGNDLSWPLVKPR